VGVIGGGGVAVICQVVVVLSTWRLDGLVLVMAFIGARQPLVSIQRS
jgi:hypothetical protein